MSRETLEQLREKALQLSEPERARLAHDLIASLDGPPDADAAEAWNAEIARRLKEIDDGSVQTIDWDDLMRSIRRRTRLE